MKRLSAVLIAIAVVLASAAQAQAATTKTEAESMPTPPACWSTTSWWALSNGAGRFCFGYNQPLTWTVSVPSGSDAVARLYGYRDNVARSARVRVDSGPWVGVTLQGSMIASTHFYTSPTLGVGQHSLQIEMTGDAAFTLDYGTLESEAAAPPPPPPPPNECAINPLDGQAAIAAAIQSCPDGTAAQATIVRFPAGRTYTQTDAINVEKRSHLILDLNGSKFTKTSPAQFAVQRPQWRIIEGSDVTLRNGTIKGALQPGPREVPPSNQWEHGVFLLGGTDHVVEDVQIDDVFGDGVATAKSGYYYNNHVLQGEQPTNHLIQRVRVESAKRMCIGITAGTGITVQDSKLIDCRYASIDIETDAPGVKIHDTKILNNTCTGFYLFCVGIAGPVKEQVGQALADDIRDIEIRGNVTTTPSDTCWPAVSAARGPISNVSVNGNPDLRSQGDGIRLEDVHGGSVTGNKISVTNRTLCNNPSVPVRLLGTTTGVTVGPNTTVGY